MRILISTAAWEPSRKATLERLIAQVMHPNAPVGTDLRVFSSEKREPSHVWARRLWEAADGYDEDAILLNDDVEVSPDLLKACEAIMAATDAAIVSLHTSLPIARSIADAGARYLTTYWATGPAYILRRGVPKTLLAFADSMPKAWYTSVNEDVVMNQWAFSKRRPILSTIPALAKHDTSVRSTLGYDNHIFRTTPVPWDDPTFEGVDLTRGWELDGDPVYAENPWQTVAMLEQMEKRLVGVAEATSAGAGAPGVPMCSFCAMRPAFRVSKSGVAAVCAECTRGLAAQVGARFAKPKSPNIVIGTPLKGHPHMMHAAAIGMIKGDDSVCVDSLYEVSQEWMASDDLVRVRSRMVRDVVEMRRRGHGVTHLWFVDGDIAPTVGLLRAMLSANKEMVCAPYPLRVLDWNRIEEARGDLDKPLEASGYRYLIEALPGQEGPCPIDPTLCTEVGGMGLGCALIKVDLLEAMTERWAKIPEARDFTDDAWRMATLMGTRPDDSANEVRRALEKAYELGKSDAASCLTFDDFTMPGTPKIETVALFSLVLKDRRLYSEDLSFCSRVREMGEKVWMYVGPGAPVSHYGEMAFRGMPESLDIRPLQQEAAQ